MSKFMDNYYLNVRNSWHMNNSNPETTAIMVRQLLLQLGDRLRVLRKAQKLSAVEVARRVGISRTTLAAVEAGDPGPSIGTYLRVMSVLGIGGDLALLAGDALQAAPHGSAGARSRRPRPTVQVVVSTDTARHQAQDLQSLALNEAAVAFIQSDPALVRQAQEVLERWMASGPMRSRMLWAEWQSILRDRQWRKVLGRTRRAQELRQTSPIVTVLPDAVRQQVLAQVRALGSGVALGDTVPMTGP